jgi:DNA-binding transcriptional MerR regulator
MDIAPVPTTDAPRLALKMRDLTAGTQFSRQAIHFYMAEGLLPPPIRSGRNMAVYAPEHLERLHWIKKLQRDHFLSLSAIKSVLNGEDVDGFSPEQQQLLRRVRDELPDWLRPPERDQVRIADLIGESLSEADLIELAQAGLIEISGSGAKRSISQTDREIADCFIQYGQAGASRNRGYRPSHLASMNEAIDGLVQQFAQLYAAGWQDAPTKEAAAFLEAVLPIDERMMAILLRKRFRAMLGSVDI